MQRYSQSPVAFLYKLLFALVSISSLLHHCDCSSGVLYFILFVEFIIASVRSVCVCVCLCSGH